jgi:hypothetical protein
MNVWKSFLTVIIFLAVSTVSLAQQDQFISYQVDGKKFNLTNVKLQSSQEGDFIHIEGTRIDKVDFGEGAIPRYREIEVGVTIEVSLSGAAVGTHVAHASDIMPVYVSWYEVKKDGSRTDVKPILASMDSGAEDMLEFSVTFENFGPTGALIKGSFSGKLLDEDENAHRIAEGKFAIKRTDMEE